MIIKKTYARHRSISLRPEEPLAKRRRVEAGSEATTASFAIDAQRPLEYGIGEYQNGSSSPTVVKSDPASQSVTAPSTPASSPPPASAADEPTKSMFDRQQGPQGHHISPVLPAEGDSHQERKTKPPDKPKPKRFTQLTLDLGQAMDRHCKECGMTYRPSNVEDREMHKKYHAKHSTEIQLSKPFLHGLLRQNAVWSDDTGQTIVKIIRSDELMKRSHTEKVLDIVERELGGVGIPSTLLWSQTTGGEQRFAVFLHLHGDKCLGACVVQRIEKALRVVAPENNSIADKADRSVDRSIYASEEEYPATIGISRIWTSNRARRKGIARRLLEVGVQNFDFTIAVQKEEVAFSQPTDSGARLARAWFGNEYGWLVYAE